MGSKLQVSLRCGSVPTKKLEYFTVGLALHKLNLSRFLSKSVKIFKTAPRCMCYMYTTHKIT